MDRPRLLARRCATCVFHPGNRMHLAPGRLAELVRDNLAAGALLICHDTLPYGAHPEAGEAMCRGFFDAHAERTATWQVLTRLFGADWWQEVDPPGEAPAGA